jgi:hypothetical protein
VRPPLSSLFFSLSSEACLVLRNIF